MVVGAGFEPAKLSRQIYSLIPLATREPHLNCGADSAVLTLACQVILFKNYILTKF